MQRDLSIFLYFYLSFISKVIWVCVLVPCFQMREWGWKNDYENEKTRSPYRIARRVEQRSTKDMDFVDPRGDKYFRFVRTKKGSVNSRLGCNEAWEASKAREAPPWNKRIIWTRFDIFEYLISPGLKPSHHSRLTTLATIEVKLTKDRVLREVTWVAWLIVF